MYQCCICLHVCVCVCAHIQVLAVDISTMKKEDAAFKVRISREGSCRDVCSTRARAGDVCLCIAGMCD